MIPGSEQIESIVLQKITPTTEEKKQLHDVVKSLTERVNREIKKTKIPITIELVGSIAKDTFVRTSVDIDLFPVSQHLRLALGKVCLHVERSLWKIEGILYVDCHSRVVS